MRSITTTLLFMSLTFCVPFFIISNIVPPDLFLTLSQTRLIVFSSLIVVLIVFSLDHIIPIALLFGILTGTLFGLNSAVNLKAKEKIQIQGASVPFFFSNQIILEAAPETIYPTTEIKTII